ncbi:MAG: type II toxin-antitoxin system VapB family antitoxin [Acidobacteriota bacterium]
MASSLNIKSTEAHKLAHELAEATGETLTAAVTVALKERLQREGSARKKKLRSEWLDRVTSETAAIMNDGRSSKELVEELYDPETGLPR